jgi:hypothetical protein
MQTKIASCFAASNPVETANNVRVADFFKGRGKSLTLEAIEEVAMGQSPAATFWGAVREALTAPVPSGPSNPMEAAFAAQDTTTAAPSPLGEALKGVKVAKPKKATKKATAKVAKKGSKRPSAATNPKSNAPLEVRKAVHAAVTKVAKGAEYKALYNRTLVEAGFETHYA